MSVNMNDLPALPISDYPVGSWYLQIDEDGCKVPWIRLCVGTEEDWCSLQSLIKLENDPTKGCCNTLDCGCLNIPTSHIWRRTASGDEGNIYVPRNIMTPIPLGETRADTPQVGGHGDGLCIPCDGLWRVEADIRITHPLDEDEPGPPWSADALFGLFVGNGPGQTTPGFMRETSNSWSQNGLYALTIYTDRVTPIRGGTCYYNNLFWEDVDDDALGMVEITRSTLKATLMGCMPDDYDGEWAS